MVEVGVLRSGTLRRQAKAKTGNWKQKKHIILNNSIQTLHINVRNMKRKNSRRRGSLRMVYDTMWMKRLQYFYYLRGAGSTIKRWKKMQYKADGFVQLLKSLSFQNDFDTLALEFNPKGGLETVVL